MDPLDYPQASAARSSPPYAISPSRQRRCRGSSDIDLAFAQKLVGDLPVQGPLVRFSFGEDCVYDRQEDVGPLLLDLSKNGCCVCSATPSEKASPTAWISTPSRSSSPSSFLRTERL